jgi:putative transposase
MGGARFVYNKGVEHVRRSGQVSRSELRQKFAAEGSDLVKQHTWLAKVPYKIREQATDDLYKAHKANLARRANDPKHRKWTFKYKSRKNGSAWTIGLVSQCFQLAQVLPRPETRRPRKDGTTYAGEKRRNWTKLRVFKDKGNEMGDFWATEAIPDTVLSGAKGVHAIKRDCRITMDMLGHFHLCVPIPNKIPLVSKPEKDRNVVALDPGVRTFQAYYSPDCHGGYAEGDFSQIFSLCEKMDAAIALAKQQPQTRSTRSMYRAQVWRLRQRIRNLVDETHKKVSLDLIRKFDTVLIPEFKSKDMAQKKREDGTRRAIRSKTARSLLTWAHYRFRERLQHKALQHGKEVAVVTEEYTSKTCGKCGHVNATFSSKTFTCAACGVTMDRDANGARNIFLKQIKCSAV